MAEPSWLKVAQSLPLDGTRRMQHDCGGGQPLIVFHRDEGWSAYCHRCGPQPGMFVPRPMESLSDRLAREAARKQVEAAVQADKNPPLPMIADVQRWPAAARVWLYKAGLSNDMIYQLGIYYHELSDRVVIPMVEAGRLVYWQARDYKWTPSSTRPKYLNAPASSARGGVLVQHETTAARVDAVTFCEDYLSAVRVSGAGVDVHCLLGTKLSDAVLARCIRRGVSRYTVWLDNDTGRGASNPGQEAATKIVAQLRASGLVVRNIVSDRDPKSYSRHDIINIMKGTQWPDST